MSKAEIATELQAEMKRINRIIDHKILRGLPYKKEARYHKLLRARLGVVRGTGFLAKLKTVSAFML